MLKPTQHPCSHVVGSVLPPAGCTPSMEKVECLMNIVWHYGIVVKVGLTVIGAFLPSPHSVLRHTLLTYFFWI